MKLSFPRWWALTAALLIPIASPAAGDSFLDDFEAPSLNTERWAIGSLFAPVTTEAAQSIPVGVVSGQLQISPLADFPGENYSGILSNIAFDLNGGAVSVEAVAADAGTLSWLALGESNNFLFMALSGGTLFLDQRTAGVADFTSVPFDAVQHRFWRIRHVPGTDTVVFEAGPDGTNWTELRSVARQIPIGALRVELASGTFGETGAPVPTRFDNLRVATQRAPLVTQPLDQLNRAGTAATLAISAADEDGDTLVYSAIGLPTGLVIDASTGVISGTIEATAEAQNTVTVLVNDGLFTSTVSFNWTVTPPLVASFSDDFEATELDLTRWTVGVGYAAVFGAADEAITVGVESGRLLLTPRANFADASYRGLVSRQAVDLRGASVSVEVSPYPFEAVSWLAVGQADDYAFISHIGGKLYCQQTLDNVSEFVELNYDPVAHRFWRIRHETLGDRLIFEASPNGTVWTVLQTYVRTIPVDYVQIELMVGSRFANGETSASAFDNLSYQLSPPNQAPTLVAPPAQVVLAGRSLTLPVAASDPDGNILTFSASGLPAGVNIDRATGVISGAPTQLGQRVSTISVTDGALSATVALAWEVKPDTGLEPIWTVSAIGAPAPSGSASFAEGVYTLTSAGRGVNLAGDGFQYAWQQFTGDGELICQVTSQAAASISARAGIVFRESLQPNSRFGAVYLTPGRGIVFESRTATGSPTGVTLAPRFATPNNWLRLIRSGDTITAFRSSTGAGWIQIGSARVPMTNTLTVGLIASSNLANSTATSTFTNVSFTPSTVPAPWRGGDVGSPQRSELESFANGTFTVNGGGIGYTGTVDGGHFTSQTLTGDGVITARVASQSNTFVWAKAGVMIRDNYDARGRFALISLTQGFGIFFQTRNAPSAAAVTVGAPRGDRWLRLVRTGNTITGFRSANGVTWTQVGAATVPFGQTISIGLAVTASASNLLSTATFDNVTVTPTAAE